MILVHNERMLGFIKPTYRLAEIESLYRFLLVSGTFGGKPLSTGLFPASRVTKETRYTGYGHVWVRDNVHIAYSRLLTGRTAAAVHTARTLCRFFRAQSARFDALAKGDRDPRDAGARPWIRFDATRWDKPAPDWAHAQNDALGYFLWLYCLLANRHAIRRSQIDWEVISRFPIFFEAISFWKDEDSGHWEEQRKISASSIGTVLAGLRELKRLLDVAGRASGTDVVMLRKKIDTLIINGNAALVRILPWECRQSDPKKRRRYDAALLFLRWPLEILDPAGGIRILEEVRGHLAGSAGIRRYLGDSFWCSDYKEKLPPGRRTCDVSLSVEERDALTRPGEEAEWCLFDPVLSIICGLEWRRTGRPRWLDLQVHHFNRSLGQLTEESSGFPEFRCPELYYRERGKWQPSDATPLLWTQGLLEVAFRCMRDSLRRSGAQARG